MRLRGRKGTLENLEQQTDLVVLDPEQYFGRWSDFFGNDRPIHVELGMGKGRFISEISFRNPEMNYIGIDRYDELIYRASVKAREKWAEQGTGSPPNLALVRYNIETIERVFAAGEIERIYLNFSDPWPKKRHVRRRLTHPRFLEKYKAMLVPGGEIHLKTDSVMLFEYSLNTFSEMDWKLKNITFNLHADGIREEYITTEYEQKFIERGQPIYRCEALVR